MHKNFIVCAIILFLPAFLHSAQKETLVQRQAKAEGKKVWDQLSIDAKVKLRMDLFNQWKQRPDIVNTSGNSNDAPNVQAYIYLTMFINVEEEKAKSPELIAEATQFAQQLCPTFAYWPEHFQISARTRRGKAYTNEECVELNFGREIHEIVKLKMQLALLKGANPALIPTKPDWKKELEIVKSLMEPKDNWSNIFLLPKISPVKWQEIDQLKKEVRVFSTAENLAKALGAVKQVWAAQDELASVQVCLRQLQSKFEKKKVKHAEAILEQGKALKNLEDAANEQRVAFERSQRELHVRQDDLAELQIKAEESNKQQKQAEKQLQDFKSRLRSLMAVYQHSNTTGWETLFAHALKEELK